MTGIGAAAAAVSPCFGSSPLSRFVAVLVLIAALSLVAGELTSPVTFTPASPLGGDTPQGNVGADAAVLTTTEEGDDIPS